MRRIYIFVFLTFVISIANCDLSAETKNRFVNAFVNYLNNIPDQKLVYEDGVFLDAKTDDDITYKIDVLVTTSELHNLDNHKQLQCSGKVLDMGENGVIIPNADYHCWEPDTTTRNPDEMLEEVVTDSRTEYEVERKVIQLDNEIQANNEPTSGEQFIAVPRERPSPCIGCSTHVDPHAAGVTELAQLGILHLDRHDPNARHGLKTVHDVERQVQVVNGVRYILTITVDYNNCATDQTENCIVSKPCKISILEKPWMKLPDGSKYRAILSNNCTEQWQYGDEGEVVNQNPGNNVGHTNEHKGNDNPADSVIKVIHNTDVQASQKHEKQMTEEELRNLEQQIIPLNKFDQPNRNEAKENFEPINEPNTVRHIEQSEAAKTATGDSEKTYLNEDRRKAVDDMLNFFSFAGGLDEAQSKDDSKLRLKRSFNPDIIVMSLAERYQKLKSNIHNVKNIYKLGKVLVNHINEMDMEVKTRILSDVIIAEEEYDGENHFFYLQVRVVIPCDKAACDTENLTYKICNGIIDDTNHKSPAVLSYICYNQNEVKSSFGSIKSIQKNDPVLIQLIAEAINKIESDTKSNALKLKTITDANIQRVSGLLTKMSIILEYTDCNNTVPTVLRTNCTILRHLGSKICEIEIIERHWLKEKKITYTCTNRTLGDSFVGNPDDFRFALNDPKVQEITQEALEYLETQSNLNYKQKILEIKSVNTEVVAGLVIKIDFLVGYTDCKTGKEIDLSACKLVDSEKPRLCHVEVWERPWLEDGRQVKVICDELDLKSRHKRQTGLLLGGETKQDPESTIYKELAQKSLQKYITISGVTHNLEVIRVDEVTTQVVSGSITRINFTVSSSENSGDSFKCFAKIWEQEWLKKQDITITCEPNQFSRTKRDISYSDLEEKKHLEDFALRMKRHMPGSKNEDDPNDPKYLDLASKSLVKYVSDSGITQQLKVLSVNKVTKQVVAGSLYEITFTVSPSGNSGDTFNCLSKVWDRPWLKEQDINITCEPNQYSRTKRDISYSDLEEEKHLEDFALRMKRHMPGSKNEDDPNDPKYLDLASKSLVKYVSDSGITQQLKVLSVNKVTKQVVAGSLYEITFTVSPSGNSGDTFNCLSKVWDRPWLKEQDINITCEPNQYSRTKRDISYSDLEEEKHLEDFALRMKRHMPGSKNEDDPNDPKYLDLASKSLVKYVSDSGITQQLKVLSVNKVTKQVVAGSLYEITFTVSPSGNSGDTFNCLSKVWDRPWLKEQDINITCEPNQYSRTKRDISYSDLEEEKHLEDFALRMKRHMPGSKNEDDPNDPKYLDLASKSLVKYVSDSGITQQLKVLSVNKVTKQVVAGSLYEITFTVSPSGNSGDTFNCLSKVWDRPWLKEQDINITCEPNQYSRTKRDISYSDLEEEKHLEDFALRMKRHMPGSKNEDDPNDPKYLDLASKSLVKYVSDSGITQQLKVLSVNKVTKQVVAGSLYEITFTVSPSVNSGDTFNCLSKVWDRPWLKELDIDITCEPNQYSRTKRDISYSDLEEKKHLEDFALRMKRHTPGSENEDDPNDPKYLDLASKSLAKYVSDSGITQQLQVMSVNKVTKQVVAGSLYKITFIVSPFGNSGASFKCLSKIWDRPWLQEQVINITCEPNQYSKINDVFDEVMQDAEDEQYRSLAVKSLKKYVRVSGITERLRVLSLDSVTKQIKDGSIIKLDFTVSQSGTEEPSFRCHSEIYKRIWAETVSIKVSCEGNKYAKKLDDGPENIEEIPDESKHLENFESRIKRSLSGGLVEKDPNDPKYLDLASKSLTKYVSDSGITQQLQVLSVNEVTEQVVAGSLIQLNFTVSPSENSGNSFKCISEVWEQIWLKKQEIKINCEANQYKRTKRDTNRKSHLESNESVRVKRRAFDEIVENPSEPKYHDLASKSLRKYVIESGVSESLRVLHVEKVTSQIYNGTFISMDFTVSPPGTSEISLYCHSDILEQIWVEKKYINVACHQKRQSGAQSSKNPNSPEYYELASKSLAHYVSNHSITEQLQVVHVDKVTYQIVSGSLTRINFTVSPSKNAKDQFKCYSEIWEQVWLQKKEFDVTCEANKYSRRKRDLADAMFEENSNTKIEYLPNGIKRRVFHEVIENPSEHRYHELASKCLKKYMRDYGLAESLRLMHVDRVTTQINNGSFISMDFTVSPLGNSEEILFCHSDILEQIWAEKTYINVSCHQGQFRSAADADKLIYDIHMRDTVKLAFEEYLKDTDYIESPVNEGLEVKSINNISTDFIDAELITLVNFTVWQKGNLKDSFSCVLNLRVRGVILISKDTVCQNNKYFIANTHTRRKRDVFYGGVIQQNASYIKYQELAEACLQKHLQFTGNRRIHKVITVENVTTQLVSGKITRLDFKIAPTSCMIDDDAVDDQSCTILDSKEISCHSEVWERPWLKSNTKIIDVTCNDPFKNVEINKTDQLRNKRRSNQKGGQKRQDPTKPVYKKLSEESLLKYLMSQNIDIHHKVTKVQNVLTQVVAGTVFNIDFVASPTSCTVGESDLSSCHLNNSVVLYCHTQIWHRPWIKNKKIDITCESAIEADDDNEEYDDEDNEYRKKRSPGQSLSKNVHDPKYEKLAKEALLKYHKEAKLEYVYKFNKIEYVEEQIVAGKITNIDFTITPTNCLRNNIVSVKIGDCSVTKTDVKYKCHAKIEKLLKRSGVTIHCSIPEKKSMVNNHKSILKRGKRQNAADDDYLDEEARYYYADRAIAEYNSRLPTQNLFKVVSIHDLKRSVNMDTLIVRMYIEIAMTYCMRRGEEHELSSCDEIDGINHKLCLVKLAPSPDDELIVQEISITCNDEHNFEALTGLSIYQLVRDSIEEVEKNPEITFKMVRQGEPYVIPSLDYRIPTKINFIAVTTNCTKDVKDAEKRYLKCAIDPHRTSKLCTSNIFFERNSKKVHHIKASCRFPQSFRKRRDISLNPNNATADDKMIQALVQVSLEKLELSSLHRYKQRVLNINSYSTKITTGKLTTIDFDVGYTNCLKFEWVDDVTTCEFLEHLPRRHCVAEIMERLWLQNGKQITVNCADDETPLEAHIEFENAATAMQLANEALKHIEAKYPNPRKQKIVRIFSLEKQAIAGLHYRMKVEVGLTDCMALSIEDKCNLVDTGSVNKFCRVNVWLRPWTEQPASYRIVCDYQEGTSSEVYHLIQAEHLFYDFLTTYKPDYMNDHSQLKKRFEIFRANVKRIHELNTNERGTARYAVTRFADLSVEEFKSKYLGLDLSLREGNNVPMRQASIPKVELPDKFDWRDFDMVTEVKDQGSCGSCWAFSVTGNVEGQWKMKSGKLIPLSEQELVDCDSLDNGCNGGLPDNAYRAIEQLGGLETETDYPYEGENDKCSFNRTLSRVQISGAVNISSNETDMAKWLVQNGPISIGINANAMQFYVAGISHPWKVLCNPGNLDHGVLIVGYGAKDYPLFHKHLPYWIIKNSWGPSWGEQGYYRVYRGDGTCGVNLMASSAVV